jgi:hypothetical protein
MKFKFWSVIALVMAMIFSSCIIGCNNGGEVTASIVFFEEKMLVIKVEKTDAFATLMDTMKELKDSDKITYNENMGMITAINEVDAPEGYSWFLYTSDKDFSNTEWGTVSYNGQTYGSAVLGASTLIVNENEIYIWSLEKWAY